MPRDHTPIRGHLLTRANHETIPHNYLRDRNTDFFVPADDRSVLGAHVQQFAQRLRGLPLRARLKPPTQEQERDHHARGLQVHRLAWATNKQCPNRPQVRRRRTQRDQRVHGHRAVLQIHPRRTVEHTARGEKYERRSRQRRKLPIRELQPVNHADQHHRQRHQRRPNRRTFQLLRFIVARLIESIACRRRPVPTRFPTVFVTHFKGVVAGGADFVDKQLRRRRRRIKRNTRSLCGVIYRRVHAVELVQLALNTRRARRTGHPCYAELDLLQCHRRLSHGPTIYP